jgi:hypothetical protein
MRQSAKEVWQWVLDSHSIDGYRSSGHAPPKKMIDKAKALAAEDNVEYFEHWIDLLVNQCGN